MLIKNGLVLTMDEDRTVMKGPVAIQGPYIKEVGVGGDEKAEKVIDAEGKIVMPGLVCAYTMPWRILLRGAPLKLESFSDVYQILQRVWWPMDDKLSNKDSYFSTLATCLEFIKSGTTFFSGTHSSQGSIGKSLDHVASAVEEAGLRALIGFEASERNTRAEGARGMRENIRFLENRQKRSLERKRVGGMVALQSSSTSSNELLQHGKRVMDQFDAPLVVPASGCGVDLYHNLKEYGKRTIERFRDVGMMSPKTVLPNCVGLNDDDLEIIKKSGAGVVHTPMSNLVHGTGIAQLSKVFQKGIPVGLGNDGYITDGFENMRSMYLTQKAKNKDPRVISPMEALELATIRSAELYGMGDKIGSIEPGKWADIVVLDCSDLSTPLRRENTADHIVGSLFGKDVETMLVDGEVIMENRSIKTLDENKVLDKSKQTAKKIWKELEVVER